MKQKTDLTSVLWAILFSVSFTVTAYLLSRYSIPLAIALLLVTVNAVVFAVYTMKFISSISSMDEVQIRIQLEAVSVAFVLSLLSVMVLGLAQLIESLGLQKISFLYIFPLFFLFYFMGLFFSQRKYQ